MKKTISLAFATYVLCALLSSCSTVFTGTKQNIEIKSVPPGAAIEISGEKRGITPTTVRIGKSQDGVPITLTADGYESKIFHPETEFNKISIINLANLLGWGVDALTGAMWKYSRSSYEVELTPKKAAGK